MPTMDPWMVDELADLDDVSDWAPAGWKHRGRAEATEEDALFRPLLEDPDVVAPESHWRP